MPNKKFVTDVEHVWSILSSKSTLDADTNNLSLIDVIEKLTFAAEPQKGKEKEFEEALKKGGLKLPADIVLTTRFRRKAKEASSPISFEVRYVVTDANDKELSSLVRPVELKSGIKNMRARLNLRSFPVTTSGDYTISLSMRNSNKGDFVPVGRVPVEVVLEVK